ncbi:putative ribonuclease H-like domain-containing protein [Tanacetum coccineum]
MMTYLKNMGGYKHSQLKAKTFAEIQGLYERQKRVIDDFKPMDSDDAVKDSKEAAGVHKQKVLKEPNSTKVEVKQEGHEESIKKRPGRRLKMKATKISASTTESLDLDGSSRWIKTFSKMVTRFDRLDFVELYNLVMKRFETTTPKGVDLVLWGDLRTMFDANAEDGLWQNQEIWNLKSWDLYENCGVYTLILLVAGTASEDAYTLLRFIQKQIDEYGSHDGGHQELLSPVQTVSELASPKQMALGKDISNPLIVDSLLKTIWLSMHHVIAMKHWLFQSKRLLGRIVGFQKFLQLSAATYTSYCCQFYLYCQYIISTASIVSAVSRSDDEIPPPPQTSTQQAPHTVSTIKLPILKKGEYDIWAMKMEHYLSHIDYPIWEVYKRERERKARTTLLMALPEDHLAKFHKMTDAKDMFLESSDVNLEIHGAGVYTEVAQSRISLEFYKKTGEKFILMPRNQLDLTRPNSNATIVTRKGILLESADQKGTLDINQKTMEGDLENRRNLKLWHMTGNKAYLTEYQDYNGGPVAFGGSKGYITGKGKIKTGKLDFKDVCFVKELHHFNLFFVSQMCDKNNKVLFTDTECLVLSSNFKLSDENQVLLRIPRQNNMHSFNLENIVPSGEFKNRDIIEFGGSKGIKGNTVNARTSTKNGSDERREQPVRSENQANKTACPKEAYHSAGTQENNDAGNSEMETESAQDYFVWTIWSSYTSTVKSSEAKNEDEKTNKNTGLKTNKKLTPSVLSPPSPSGGHFLHLIETYTTRCSLIPALEDFYDNPSDVFPTLTDTLYSSYISILGDLKSEFKQGRKSEQMFCSGMLLTAAIQDSESLDSYRFTFGKEAIGTKIGFTDNKKEEKGVDKYVAEILKKFDFASVKTASTPIETQKSLTKDEEAVDVDVTPKTSHLNAMKRIFRYLKGKPKLGLWYPRVSSFDLEAYSDSDYAGCKKQTIVATSTTKAEYVAATNCYGKVLWIQNQMLDYRLRATYGAEFVSVVSLVNTARPTLSTAHGVDAWIESKMQFGLELRVQSSYVVTLLRAWLKSVKRLSMKKRLGRKESVSKQGRKNAKLESTLDALDDLDAGGRDYIREEEASKAAIVETYDEVQEGIDADALFAAKLQQEEREEYTIEEKAKFLAETITAQRKFRAAQRSDEIRSRPPTKSQLRNLMMTYLKNMGGYKHSQLKAKTFAEIQDDAVKDSKEAAIVQKQKVLEEPNSTNVEVKKEGHEESIRKRLGRRLKMKATKKSKRQKTDVDLEEEEQLKAFLKIVSDEEGIIDYEVLEKRFPIIIWESKFYDFDRHGAVCIYYRIFRSDGSSRWIKTFSEMVTRFDRLDLEELYNLVMKRFETTTPEGVDLVLWGDLRIMFDANAEDELWQNQERWNLKSWDFYENYSIHTLILEDGIKIHMLAERKYPLTKETLDRMLSLRLVVGTASEDAYTLLRFIQKQIDEYGSHDGGEKDF